VTLGGALTPRRQAALVFARAGIDVHRGTSLSVPERALLKNLEEKGNHQHKLVLRREVMAALIGREVLVLYVGTSSVSKATITARGFSSR
jgi:hypothetical protein